MSNVLPCGVFHRITLLRLKPYMFEPNDDDQGGLRVKQPLASFLGKFKSAPVCLPILSSGCTILHACCWVQSTGHAPNGMCIEQCKWCVCRLRRRCLWLPESALQKNVLFVLQQIYFAGGCSRSCVLAPPCRVL